MKIYSNDGKINSALFDRRENRVDLCHYKNSTFEVIVSIHLSEIPNYPILWSDDEIIFEGRCRKFSFKSNMQDDDKEHLTKWWDLKGKGPFSPSSQDSSLRVLG